MKNIEWLKEEIGELPCVDTVFNSDGLSYIDSAVPVMAVYDLINELDEPEKPVIPKFVADYLCRAKEDITLMRVMELANTRNELPKWEKQYDWISENDEEFARAWLDGYEVEKEKRYCVRENNFLLCKYKDEVIDYLGAVECGVTDLVELKLTEKEIKDYDERYWAFAQEVTE